KRKVPILFDAPIVELTADQRGVKGARLKVGSREISVKARKGVVLATGGYAHNKTFREAYMPQPVPAHCMSYEGNTGDGLQLGQCLGAALTPAQCPSGVWSPGSIVPRRDVSRGLFPHHVLARANRCLIPATSAGRPLVQG